MGIHFVVWQLIPELGVSSLLTWLITVVGLLYVVVGFVPDEPGGKKSLVHGIAAYGAFYLLMFFMFAIALSATSSIARVISFSSATILLLCPLNVKPHVQKSHDLYWQLAAFAAFDIGVLALYYV